MRRLRNIEWLAVHFAVLNLEVFAETGRNIGFSPNLNAVRQTSEPIDALVEAAEARAFAHRFIRFIPDFRGYSKSYSWTSGETYNVRVGGV